MKAVTYTAPASWATYLINHDSDDLDYSEVAAALAWLSNIGLGLPVSAGDDTVWARDYDHCSQPGERVEIMAYTFLAPRKVKTIAHLVPVNAQGYTGNGMYIGALTGSERLYYVERDGLSGYYRAPNRAAAIARYESLRRTRDDGTPYLGADW